MGDNLDPSAVQIGAGGGVGWMGYGLVHSPQVLDPLFMMGYIWLGNFFLS